MVSEEVLRKEGRVRGAVKILCITTIFKELSAVNRKPPVIIRI
jgi:hypothetical protein